MTARQRQEPVVPRWIFWPSIFLVLLMYGLPGLFSSYRAWVQVHSLALTVPRREIGSGDTIRVNTVSWARTWVDVDVVLLQGIRAETLAVHRIPKNRNASIDPRWRRDSIIVVLADPLLARYKGGAAIIRAHAVGGPQWLRTPPPLVRETIVQLAHSPVGHRSF
ncbi:MAG: hypothetical protein ACJ8AJ_02480 [Gemmatimonadaceae bacterium]